MIQDDDGIKLQVDRVGLDLTVLIDTRQVYKLLAALPKLTN